MAQWEVRLEHEFRAEFDALPTSVQDALGVALVKLSLAGPSLGRPIVDQLSGSRYSNMKEIRLTTAGGAWRFAFAFDPKRRAIILVGGDKAGVASKRFYSRLISVADKRFARHLADLEKNNA